MASGIRTSKWVEAIHGLAALSFEMHHHSQRNWLQLQLANALITVKMILCKYSRQWTHAETG
jgi:hypothetical protein